MILAVLSTSQQASTPASPWALGERVTKDADSRNNIDIRISFLLFPGSSLNSNTRAALSLSNDVPREGGRILA
jgi:hypothetical protein